MNGEELDGYTYIYLGWVCVVLRSFDYEWGGVRWLHIYIYLGWVCVVHSSYKVKIMSLYGDIHVLLKSHALKLSIQYIM